MTPDRRPVAILLLSFLYIAVGTVGFVAHFPQLMARQEDSVWIELTEFLAVISGAFMLRRQNWARWLALIWMAFHVAISFPVLRLVAIHSLFLAVIVWVLFRFDARRYFATAGTSTE